MRASAGNPVERLQHDLRSGPDLVHLGQRTPAHHPVSAHDEDGRPGDPALLVLHPVSADDLALRVGEQREREAQLCSERLRSRERIDRDRDDLGAPPLELSDLPLQLSELLAAVGSPVAAVEDQDRGAVAGRAREVPRLARRRGKGDGWCPGAQSDRPVLDPCRPAIAREGRNCACDCQEGEREARGRHGLILPRIRPASRSPAGRCRRLARAAARVVRHPGARR